MRILWTNCTQNYDCPGSKDLFKSASKQIHGCSSLKALFKSVSKVDQLNSFRCFIDWEVKKQGWTSFFFLSSSGFCKLNLYRSLWKMLVHWIRIVSYAEESAYSYIVNNRFSAIDSRVKLCSLHFISLLLYSYYDRLLLK